MLILEVEKLNFLKANLMNYDSLVLININAFFKHENSN